MKKLTEKLKAAAMAKKKAKIQIKPKKIDTSLINSGAEIVVD